MKPTTHLRFVMKPVGFQLRHVLQQLWVVSDVDWRIEEVDHLPVGFPGEWRDVPVVDYT